MDLKCGGSTLPDGESMFDAYEEQEYVTPVYKWAKSFTWKKIYMHLWEFANNTIPKTDAERDFTIMKVGGWDAIATIYCRTFVRDAKSIGATVIPEYKWLYNSVLDDCVRAKEKLKEARTIQERGGLINVYLKQAHKATKDGDIKRAGLLYSRSDMLRIRLNVARQYLSGANRFLMFLRTRGHSIHDANPTTLYKYLGTPEYNYLDGALQSIQKDHHFLNTHGTPLLSPTTIANHEKYAKEFTILLTENGVFNAYDADGVLKAIAPFEVAAVRAPAKPNPYRITLDQYLGFPRTIFDKKGKLRPDVNEVLLIYKAIQDIKGEGKLRDYYGKYADHSSLLDIIVRTIRETGARPANLRWLQWQDFKVHEADPFIAWGVAGEEERGDKHAPGLSYISKLLAEAVKNYYTSRYSKGLLRPTDFIIRNEFLPETRLDPAQMVASGEVSDLLTTHLNNIIKQVYVDKPEILKALDRVGAKRFRNSMATIMYLALRDKSNIKSQTGDSLATLKKFYIQDESSEERKIYIDAHAKGRFTVLDLVERVYDTEYPPGLGRDEFLASFKYTGKRSKPR